MKFLLIALLVPLFSYADYLVGFGTGSYMGRHQLQGEMGLKNPKYRAIGILGYTKDEDMNDIFQLTLISTYKSKQIDFGNFKWDPLSSGVFATYTDHKKYYVRSPSKYKDPDYYTSTALRAGLRFSTDLVFLLKTMKPMHISLDGSLLDRGMTSLFNNPSEYNLLEEFWSIGFSVRFEL